MAGRAPRAVTPRAVKTAEQWWVLLRQVGAFLIGTFILVEQTAFSDKAQTILVLAGLAAIGVGGNVFARWLKDKFGG